jgi:N utilization substance protein B
VNSAERRTARALALQALYELDCTDHPVEQVLPARIKQADPDPDPNLDLADNGLTPPATTKISKNQAAIDANAIAADSAVDSANENRISADQRTFIYAIVNGVRSRRFSIDMVLQKYAEERPLNDIAIIDRNILRMAIYEFAIGQQTPIEAAINEAVELAKAFGADSAPRFVNGVLGAVADHEAEVVARLSTGTTGS